MLSNRTPVTRLLHKFPPPKDPTPPKSNPRIKILREASFNRPHLSRHHPGDFPRLPHFQNPQNKLTRVHPRVDPSIAHTPTRASLACSSSHKPSSPLIVASSFARTPKPKQTTLLSNLKPSSLRAYKTPP